MKIVSIITLLFVYISANNVDEMVSKINSKRASSIDKERLISIQSPMVKVVEKSTSDKNITTTTLKSKPTVLKEEDEIYNLTGIMNNRAFINGKWLKVGNRVGRYKLIDVMEDSVYLKDGNRTKLIFFKQNSGKIKIRMSK